MKRRPVLTQTIASLAEANDVLTKIGEREREMNALKNELEASIASMREAANLEIAPLEKEHERLSKSLEIFANQHRATLCVDNKKSVVLPGGEFGWRLPPTKVTFGKGGEDKILKTLTELNLEVYIRQTPSVDKEALLKDRPVIAGVKYSQKEGFYVKPETGREAETFPGSPDTKSA
jgi:phage host-nuclease inhibitor protein Gam